jgi:hypothetical protein
MVENKKKKPEKTKKGVLELKNKLPILINE